MLPAGNFGKEKRKEKKKVTMTERFQLHNTIFVSLKPGQINASIIILRIRKSASSNAPPVRAFAFVFPSTRQNPGHYPSGKKVTGSDVIYLSLIIFIPFSGPCRKHPPEILSSLHTFDLTLIGFSNKQFIVSGSCKSSDLP